MGIRKETLLVIICSSFSLLCHLSNFLFCVLLLVLTSSFFHFSSVPSLFFLLYLLLLSSTHIVIIIIIIIIIIVSFSPHYNLIVFHWCLSYRKSPQVSRTLLSILINLSSAAVWMVLAYAPISLFQLPYQALVISSNPPISIGISLTFMFQCFLVLWQGLSTCLSFHFLWFSLICRHSKVNYSAGSLFFC